MNTITQKVLKRLREEQPELLKDATPVELNELNLEKLDPEMPPSEMKTLADRIARKRLSAPGISQEEATALLRRIGHR